MAVRDLALSRGVLQNEIDRLRVIKYQSEHCFVPGIGRAVRVSSSDYNWLIKKAKEYINDRKEKV